MQRWIEQADAIECVSAREQRLARPRLRPCRFSALQALFFFRELVRPEVLHQRHANREALISLEAAQLSLRLAGQPKVVGIEESDVVPAGLFDPAIPRRRGTRVRLPEARDSVAELAKNARSAVRRAVVDDDDLDCRVRLAEHTGERLA